MTMTTLIELYVDGSSTGKVGEGGWAYVVLVDGILHYEESGGTDDTTNNRMELSAVIEGLRYILIWSDFSTTIPIKVYSDSQYVTKGISSWFPNKWKKDIERGKIIKNQDLWLDCEQLTNQFLSIEMIWVEGHSGVFYNERCDLMAKTAKREVQISRDKDK